MFQNLQKMINTMSKRTEGFQQEKKKTIKTNQIKIVVIKSRILEKVKFHRISFRDD